MDFGNTSAGSSGASVLRWEFGVKIQAEIDAVLAETPPFDQQHLGQRCADVVMNALRDIRDWPELELYMRMTLL